MATKSKNMSIFKIIMPVETHVCAILVRGDTPVKIAVVPKRAWDAAEKASEAKRLNDISARAVFDIHLQVGGAWPVSALGLKRFPASSKSFILENIKTGELYVSTGDKSIRDMCESLVRTKTHWTFDEIEPDERRSHSKIAAIYSKVFETIGHDIERENIRVRKSKKNSKTFEIITVNEMTID